MSLVRFLRGADARLRLDLVRPTAPRVEAPLAPPTRLAPPLAAAALAHAVRIELARTERLAPPVGLAARAPEALATLAPEMVDAAESALSFVRGDVGREQAATPSLVAERALQLARLDAVVRAGYVDARLGRPEDPDDLAEVAAMLAHVPWTDLGPGLAPPPIFPRLAETIPDAEPALLVGRTLVEVSASRAARVETDDLRALVARLILARAEMGPDAATRRITSVSVLLARHGILWRADAAPILAHEAFPVVEAWTLERLGLPKDGAPTQTQAQDEPAPRAPMPHWVRKRFAPKTPGTHPEGKAQKKKQQDARDEPPAPKRPPRPPRPPKPKAAWRDEPREPQGGSDDAPSRPRSSKPDWRRGSAWRRDRGL